MTNDQERANNAEAFRNNTGSKQRDSVSRRVNGDDEVIEWDPEEDEDGWRY